MPGTGLAAIPGTSLIAIPGTSLIAIPGTSLTAVAVLEYHQGASARLRAKLVAPSPPSIRIRTFVGYLAFLLNQPVAERQAPGIHPASGGPAARSGPCAERRRFQLSQRNTHQARIARPDANRGNPHD